MTMLPPPPRARTELSIFAAAYLLYNGAQFVVLPVALVWLVRRQPASVIEAC